MSDNVSEVTLYLRDVRNFFRVPEIDPFEGEDTDESGIDQLMDTLKAGGHWRRGSIRTVLRLPLSAKASPLIAQMPAALASYCTRQTQYCQRKINEIRLEGRRALRIGVLFLAACLLASAAVNKIAGSTFLLGQLLSEGLLIAGWVGLWRPLELLLFDWWPYALDIKLYEKIKAMELRIEFDPALESRRVPET